MKFGKTPSAPPLASNAQIRIHGQYVKKLEFDSPVAALWVSGTEEAASVDIEVDVACQVTPQRLSECAIDLRARASNSKGTVYEFNIVYAGLFDLADVPAAVRSNVLNVSCPAIIFPGLRNIVGTMTHEAGVGALWLDPLDWAALYQQNALSGHTAKSTDGVALSGSIQRSRMA